MTDPYEVLGVERCAEEGTIRRRYLELVRLHSPERDPQRFAEIREAYDHLRDPIVSLQNRLFNLEAPHTLESMLADAQPTVRDHRLPTEILFSLATA